MPLGAAAFGRILLVGLCAAAANPALPAAASCHIHPPPATAPASASDRPRLIGPFADHAGCESARVGLFGDLGRCHCQAAFTPERFGGSGAEPAPALPPGPPSPLP
jgi:hypothetical protein